MKSFSSTTHGKLIFPEHGGDLHHASAISGLPSEAFLDFSASINPLGPPEQVTTLLKQGNELLKSYPEKALSEKLKIGLGDRFELGTHHFMLGNGSTELIYLLPRLWKPGTSVLLMTPCFSEYEKAFTLGNIPTHKETLPPEQEFHISWEALLRRIENIPDLGGIVVGHPNSPSGNVWNPRTLHHLMEHCETSGKLLVVDETFMDFCHPNASVISHVPDSERLIVIRSFTKFYSIPGIRLGYGVMSPERVGALEKFQPPWSVNALAYAIGDVCLNDSGFDTRSRKFIETERDWMRSALQRMDHIRVFPSDAPYLLFQLETEDTACAHKLYCDLIKDGILIRNCGNFSGLSPMFFRVGIRKREENQQLLSRLSTHLSALST